MYTEQNLIYFLCTQYVSIQLDELGFDSATGDYAHVLEQELRDQFNYTQEDLNMVWDDAVEEVKRLNGEDQKIFMSAFVG